MAEPTGASAFPFLRTSQIIILLSVIAMLFNFVPLLWHIRARNVATSSIITWVMILNCINVINAAIWHNDDLASWSHGHIFCDVEVRLIVGAGYAGLPGSALSLMKRLARMLDDASQGDVSGNKQWAEECLLCFGFPLWMMVAYYAVQTTRFAVAAGYGCSPAFSASWVSIALIIIWPMLLMLVTCYYTFVVIVRLYKHQTSVSSLLARSKISSAQFRPLFILNTVLTIVMLASSTIQVWYFTRSTLQPYSWNKVHDKWNFSQFITTTGADASRDHADRWLWITYGYLSFLTLGTGSKVQNELHNILSWNNCLRKFGCQQKIRFACRLWPALSCFDLPARLVNEPFAKEAAENSDRTMSSTTWLHRISQYSMSDIIRVHRSAMLPIIEPKDAAIRDATVIAERRICCYAMPPLPSVVASTLTGPEKVPDHVSSTQELQDLCIMSK